MLNAIGRFFPFPRFPSWLGWLGLFFLSGGWTPEIPAQVHSQAQQLAAQGERFLAEGNHAQASASFEQSLKLDAQNGLVWDNLGFAYYKLDRSQESLGCFMIAATFDASRANALYNLACHFSMEENSDFALDYLRQAFLAGFNNFQHLESDTDLDFIREEPAFSELLANAKQGLTATDEQRQADAAEQFKYGGLSLLEAGLYQMAAEKLLKSLEYDKQADDVWLSTGYALQMTGMIDQAERCYRQAAELNAENSYAFYNLGCINSLRNRPDEAFEHLEKAADAGFSDWQQLESDADLNNIRGDARFADFIAAVQRNAENEAEMADDEESADDGQSEDNGISPPPSTKRTTTTGVNQTVLTELSTPSQSLEEALAKLQTHMPLMMQLINQGKNYEAMILIRAFVEGSREVMQSQSEFGMILGMLAMTYVQMNDYPSARPFVEEAVRVIAQGQGTQSPMYWDARELQARIIMEVPDIAGAQKILAEVVASKSQILGSTDPSHASTVINEALTAAFLGQAESRATAVEQALKIIAQKSGNHSLAYLDALTRAVQYFQQAGMRDRWEAAIAEIGNIADNASQPEVQVQARMQTAIQFASQSRLTEALSMMQEAIRLQEQQQTTNTPVYLRSQVFLALLHARLTAWSKAESVLTIAKQGVIDMFGPESIDYASILHQMGEIKLGQSAFAEAEQNFLDAKRILQQVSSDRHPNLAVISISLGKLYVRMGSRQRAEPLFVSAADIQRKIFGAESSQYAEALNMLGVHHTRAKNFVEAERYLNEVVAIVTKLFGEDNTLTATAQHNLAQAYLQGGKLDLADPLLRKALQKLEKSLPQLHADCAADLGELLTRRKDFDQAEKYLLASQRTLEKTVGKGHESSATTMLRLAEMYRKKGELEKATQWYQDYRVSVRQHTAKVLPGLATELQLEYLENEFRPGFQSSLALGYHLRDNPRARTLSAGWLLNGKGLVQEVLGEGALLSSSEAAPLVQELRAVRDELAKITLNLETDPQKRQRQVVQVADLETRQQELVQQISASNARGSNRNWASVGQLRESLPFGTTLINIARFNPQHDTVNIDAGAAVPADSPDRYVAWIIPSIGDGEIEIVDLGSAITIDKSVQALRVALAEAPGRIFEIGEKDAATEFRVPLKKLSDAIARPLLPYLSNTEHLILSPDSSLWLVPWSACLIEPDNVGPNPADPVSPVDSHSTAAAEEGREQFLIERFPISFVVSGRELLSSGSTHSLIGAPAIFADPDYDLAAQDPTAEQSSGTQRSAVGRQYSRLFGTAEEAQTIKSFVEKCHGEAPAVYLQAEAKESTLKQIHRPRVLVVSTHGFFTESSTAGSEDDEPANLSSKVLGASGQVYDNPLLRCGLALAGCNRRGETGYDGAEDGILTGLEIVGTDLRGTELVVLSACETGLGQTSHGEGVAGLRQAFQQAGADSVVASLWKVQDEETTELMKQFWNQLAQGQSKSVALREAQLNMIRTRREKHSAAHPVFWAAFSLTGSNN